MIWSLLLSNGSLSRRREEHVVQVQRLKLGTGPGIFKFTLGPGVLAGLVGTIRAQVGSSKGPCGTDHQGLLVSTSSFCGGSLGILDKGAFWKRMYLISLMSAWVQIRVRVPMWFP